MKKKIWTFQKEQEEIVKIRPSTQKGLNFKEIKQMEYLSKVCDIWFFSFLLYFLFFNQVVEWLKTSLLNSRVALSYNYYFSMGNILYLSLLLLCCVVNTKIKLCFNMILPLVLYIRKLLLFRFIVKWMYVDYIIV
jgi:hypothetical protein